MSMTGDYKMFTQTSRLVAGTHQLSGPSSCLHTHCELTLKHLQACGILQRVSIACYADALY